MFKSSTGAACAAMLVALAGGLTTPTASHAAVYVGVYDPANAFYQWSGNHVFTVDDACLVGDGWKEVNSNSGYGCGNARLIGGDLTVVNRRGTETDLTDDVSKTLQFSTFGFIPTGIDPFSTLVWGVNIVGGELVGVDTRQIGDFTFADPGDTHLGRWTLQWSSGRGAFCDLYFCGERPGSGSATSLGGPVAANMAANDATVTLRNFAPNFPGNGFNPNLPGPSTEVTFLRVPEPGTAALVLAALGAVGLTRRRKR